MDPNVTALLSYWDQLSAAVDKIDPINNAALQAQFREDYQLAKAQLPLVSNPSAADFTHWLTTANSYAPLVQLQPFTASTSHTDLGVQQLLVFWNQLAQLVPSSSVPNIQASFARDYAQAKGFLPSSSSVDGSGGFAKWLQIANQYAHALGVQPFAVSSTSAPSRHHGVAIAIAAAIGGGFLLALKRR